MTAEIGKQYRANDDVIQRQCGPSYFARERPIALRSRSPCVSGTEDAGSIHPLEEEHADRSELIATRRCTAQELMP